MRRVGSSQKADGIFSNRCHHQRSSTLQALLPTRVVDARTLLSTKVADARALLSTKVADARALLSTKVDDA
jgi:hypothetical protein